MLEITIAERRISLADPTYFVADIAANHDGSLDRAMRLIEMAAEAGADAAKFQHFRAPKIVSQRGFSDLGGQFSHQAKWKKSVYEVYCEASLPWEWTPELKAHCDQAGIHFFSAPYDFEAIEMLGPFVPAWKVGSGDINWLEIIDRMAADGRPVLLATGAADIGEVQAAVDQVLRHHARLILMQCNTNYTGSVDNFRHAHLRVLEAYRVLYPELLTGLSDHTPGHAAVLGAVALGARVIEKHFTDDNLRPGPDHGFAMNPGSWREMVARTRELELALGRPAKRVCENEQETVVLQRRCIRVATDLPAGRILRREDLEVLRPAPAGGLSPSLLPTITGLRLRCAVQAGQHLHWGLLEQSCVSSI